MGRYSRWQKAVVGNYTAEWWGHSYYDSETKAYVKDATKPAHRTRHVSLVVGYETRESDYYPGETHQVAVTQRLTSEQIMAADMTTANSPSEARAEQAAELEEAGYGGPVGGGEARALKRLFTELGMPNLVKHGWANRRVKVQAPMSRYQRRHWLRNGGTGPAPKVERDTWRLQHCYLFKSPVAGVPWDKFIRLARMYRDDDNGLRAAVEAVMANPEAHKEIETLDTIDILAGFGGNV